VAVLAGLLVAGWATLQKIGAPIFLPLYARLTGKDLLNNESRMALLEVVRKRHVIHLRELQRETGLGFSTVSYHAAVLKDRRLVGSVRSGREEFLYQPKAGFPATAMRSISSMASPVRKQMVEIIIAQGGATQEDLCARMGVSQPFICRQLAKLETAGLIAADGRRNKVYRPTPLVLDWMAQVEGRGRDDGRSVAVLAAS
jgi:predicted transcriptional regulator